MNDGAQTTAAATPQAGTASAAEPNTLGALIEEFNKGTATPDAAKAVGEVLKGIKPLVEHAERQQIKETSEVFAKDFDSAANELKTVPGAETMTPRQLKGFMREYGAEVPEVEQAWNNRLQSPDAWKSALTKVKAALAEDLKASPGSTLKADTLAARAAVANSTQSATPPAKFDPVAVSNMSDRDYKAWKQEMAAAQRSK